MQAFQSSIPYPLAIIGAGFLGQALVRTAKGPVIATTRSGQWRQPLPTPLDVSLHALDVSTTSLSAIQDLLRPARAVVICYAPGPSQERKNLYVLGTHRLLSVVAKLPIQRVVYISSTSALPDLDAWVDEDCPIWPTSERGKVQREAEQLVISQCTQAGIPWLILRLAGLYGPGREIARIYRNDPKGVLPGDGMEATNLIHVEDATAAVWAALSLASECQTIINVCDDDHQPRRWMIEQVANLLGNPPPMWELSVARRHAVHGKRVRNLRMKELLKVQLRYPSHQMICLSPSSQ